MNQTTTRADSLDDLLTLLADQHRRSAVAYFRESPSDDATVQELATYISEQTGEPVDRVANQLHHAKLPRLADAGVVEYDPRSRVVRYHGPGEVEHLMDCLTNR